MAIAIRNTDFEELITMSSPTAEQLSERVSRMIMAMGLIDLTEQDRKLLQILARDDETANAAADLFGRLSRPHHD